MRKQRKACNGFSDCTGRREFIRQASSMLAGAAVTGGFSLEDIFSGGGESGAQNTQQPAPAQGKNAPLLVNGLPGSRLGDTGLEVTKIGCGGMLVNEPNVLLHALETGINFVHTSPAYQNGASMAAYGKVLKENRGRVVLAVKERPEQLDRVLPVLNTDHVDIVMPPIHSPSALNDSRLYEEFQKARQAGKCRFLGFSCHSEMTTVLEKAVRMKIFDVTMINYMNTDDPWFFHSLRLARDAGMGIVAMRALPYHTYRSEGVDHDALVRERYRNILNRWYAHSIMTSMGSYQAVDSYSKMLDESIVSRRVHSTIRG